MSPYCRQGAAWAATGMDEPGSLVEPFEAQGCDVFERESESCAGGLGTLLSDRPELKSRGDVVRQDAQLRPGRAGAVAVGRDATEGEARSGRGERRAASERNCALEAPTSWLALNEPRKIRRELSARTWRAWRVRVFAASRRSRTLGGGSRPSDRQDLLRCCDTGRRSAPG